MGAADELRIVVMHPIGIGLAQTGPVVAGPLGVAGEPDKLSVQIHPAGARAAFELRLAKTRGDLLHVHHLVIDRQQAINCVEIGLAVAPKFRGRQLARRLEHLGLTADQIRGVALQFRAQVSVRIHYRGREGDGLLVAGLIAHLRLHIQRAGLVGKVVIRAVNIDARGLEVLVEWQRLINLAGQVQPEVVIQAAVIGIKRAPHPFELDTGGFLLVIIAVIHFHGDDVVDLAKIHQIRQVQPQRRHAVLIFAGGFAVDPKPAGLLEPLGFEEHLAVLGACRQLEMLAIPDNARPSVPVAAAVADELGVGIRFVIGMRRADLAPSRVVKVRRLGVGHVRADELPAGIEVENRMRRRGHGKGFRDHRLHRPGQQGQKKKDLHG